MALGILIGLIIGIALGWFIASRKGDGAAQTAELLRASHLEEKAALQQQAAQAQARAEAATHDGAELKAALAAEQERGRHAQQRLQEQKAEMEQLQARLTTEFENIANRLLSQRGRELNEQQQEKLRGILDPLHEKIKGFDELVRRTYSEEERERFALKKEITALVQQNLRLSQDADNLTRALKGESKTQGDWGEMILESMLESSGLVEGAEYSLQSSGVSADGSRLRPDAVINLPGEKRIVIDAKVSLTHYERYVATTDEVEKERLIKAHVESIRTHMKGLSQKDYPGLYGISSPEIVLMFVPIEAAFNLAQTARRELVQEAIDLRVFIVTHSTLMASLKLFHGIWKNERIARNHMEIAERAGLLYDKFKGFTDDLIAVGKAINGAQETYQESMKKLSSGAGNLVGQAEKLKQLGAKTNKSINEKLLARSIED